MAHDVFISYSGSDKSVADAICAALEGEGINCWIAPRNVLPSVEYSEAIVDAIAASSILVLVFSAKSNRSRDVASELDLAFQNEKDIPILAFRIENLKPSRGTAYYLSTSHWFDAFTPPLETHLKRLVEDVQRLLKREPTPTPAPTPTPSPTPTPMPTPLVPPVLMKILIAVGVALALFIFGRLLFKPQTGIGGNRNEDVAKNQNNNITDSANTNHTTANNASNSNNLSTNIAGNTNSHPEKTINYEEKFRTAIQMLGNNSNQQERFEGIRLFSEICESGDRDWYWKATNQLTTYVRTNARWKNKAEPLPDETKEIIAGILQVIAAREPIYPPNLTDREKIKMRDLNHTDLRDLRLIVPGGAHLEYVDFEGAYLDRSIFQDAHLKKAILKDSSLRDVDLHKADMTDVDLAGTDLYRTNLRQAKGLETWTIGVSPTWHCANLDESLSNKLRAGRVPTSKCE